MSGGSVFRTIAGGSSTLCSVTVTSFESGGDGAGRRSGSPVSGRTRTSAVRRRRPIGIARPGRSRPRFASENRRSGTRWPPAMGRPPESTTRPATVRSRGGPSVGIVTSVVLPASIERPEGRLGRSFVPSGGITLIASLPAAMAGISKRPSASVVAPHSPWICGPRSSAGSVRATTSSPRTAPGSST